MLAPTPVKDDARAKQGMRFPGSYKCEAFACKPRRTQGLADQRIRMMKPNTEAQVAAYWAKTQSSSNWWSNRAASRNYNFAYWR